MKLLSDMLPFFSPDGEGGGAGSVQDDATLLDSLDSMTDEQTVPVSVARAIRKELQGLKSEHSQTQEMLRTKDDQIFLLRTTLNQRGDGQSAGQPQGDGKVRTGTFLDEVEDDEPLTAGQAKKLVMQNASVGALQAKLAKAQSDPDFTELTTTHIANVIKADPSIGAELAALPPVEAYLQAYRLAKSDPEYHKKKMVTPVIPKPKEDADAAKAKKIEENLSKPGSPSSVQPASVASDEGERIRKMSKTEFRQYRHDAQQRGIAARKG